jgi:hypothetical protein
VNLVSTLFAIGLSPLVFTDAVDHDQFLAAVRDVESGNDYMAVSSNGLCRGAYQFCRYDWESYSDVPFEALGLTTATTTEQDRVAHVHLMHLTTMLMRLNHDVTVRRLASLWNTGTWHHVNSDYAKRVENIYLRFKL